MNQQAEHLTPETLRAYLAASTPVTVALSFEPLCHLRIDGAKQRLELWIPAVGEEPVVTHLFRVGVEREVLDESDWFVLRVDARDINYEAYSLIAAIVDDMRTGLSFDRAVTAALGSYHDLLAGRSRMSVEKAEGLVGELLILEQLISALGEKHALASWLGPASEQHDFGLQSFDAEIKTTTSEDRSHMIGSAMQLQPNPGRDLWLVSLQLTRSGSTNAGFGLPAIIGRVRHLLAHDLGSFLAHLESLGWRDDDDDLYLESYLLRSAPAAYLVDIRFPAITQDRLNSVVPQPGLVGAVSYRVNVTTLESGNPPDPLAVALTGIVQKGV